MKKLTGNKKIINRVINLGVIAIFIATIIPFFITTKYALFVTDDFPAANATIANYDGSYFRTGVKCAADYWRVWNGNWFSFTIAYWLHPLVHGGQKTLVLALRIQLFLAIAGALYFCFSLARFFELNAEKTLRIIAIVVMPVLLFKEYFDFYMWWLTSCTYLMPLYCFLFGFGTYLFALRKEKISLYILAGILLLFMSGGSLNVVGMGCYSLLLSLVAWCFYKKKICMPGVIVFITTVIGACINAFAPGSFSRQNSQNTERVGVIRAIIREIQIMGVEGKWLIFHTAFIAFVLIAFIWGSRLNKKITLANLIIATIASIGLPVVTMFPVILGYGDINYKDISNRGYGMMDISIIFGACFMAVLWGCYLKNSVTEKIKRMLILAATIIAIISVLFFGQKPSELVPIQIATNLYTGYNEHFFETWMEVYSQCENSENEDVVIEMSVPPRKAGCSWAKLGEDADKWWNEVVSIYYGINSVSLVNTYQ